MKTTIDFLRHGEAAGGSYYRGSTDDPLTEQGWQQMHKTVASHQWDLIISSPLQRCQAFAQHLHKQRNIPLSTDSNWQELDFGDWEGKIADQINSAELMLFYQYPWNNTPTNAESLNIFLSRINTAWEVLLQQHAGKHILVISHAGVIRCLFNLFLDLPTHKIFNLQLDHASLTRFECFNAKPANFITLVFHNLTPSNL
ncbi:MAG: histidine phosphatase family protein [Methylococcales bacterium]